MSNRVQLNTLIDQLAERLARDIVTRVHKKLARPPSKQPKATLPLPPKLDVNITQPVNHTKTKNPGLQKEVMQIIKKQLTPTSEIRAHLFWETFFHHSDLARNRNRTRATVSATLTRLTNKGLLLRIRRGVYRLPKAAKKATASS